MAKKKQKKIRRPTRKIGGDTQLSMIGKLFANEESKPEIKRNDSKGRQVVFNDPDPRSIVIGSQRLDELLVAMGFSYIILLRDFIRDLPWKVFEACYQGGGKKPYHPASMVGLILFGIMQGKSSLRHIETLARTDVRAWWLTGGTAPSYSSISRFISTHRAHLTDEMFEELTRKVLKVTKTKASEVAGDGTVIQAAASRYKTIKREAAVEAAKKTQAEADENPEDKGLQENAERAKQAVEFEKERAQARKEKGRDPKKTRVSPTEPEAVIQKKKDGSVAPAYKASACANKERIITAKEVDPSSETVVVPKMVEQTERVGEEALKLLMLDAGYFASLIVVLALRKEIDLLCPQGKSHGSGAWEKKSPKQLPKTAFSYKELSDTYLCPDGRVLIKYYQWNGNAKEKGYTVYKCMDCSGCPRLEKCSRNEMTRTVKRYFDEDVKEALLETMRQPKAQEQYKKRQAWIEPVFSELRCIQGLNRFRRRGLEQVRLEFSLHAMAHNLRRLLVLSGKTGALLRARANISFNFLYFLAFFRLKLVQGAA